MEGEGEEVSEVEEDDAVFWSMTEQQGDRVEV